LATALGATLAPAEAQFTSITDFGDSYADTGSAPGGAFRIAGPPFYPPCPAALGYPYCRFTGGRTNFVDSLQSIFGLPTATNYAIGGARTDNTNTLSSMGLNDGFPYELEQFALSGTHFTNSDLIALSIGGNDLSANASTDTIAEIRSSALASAQTAVTGGIVVSGVVTGGVEQLVAAGAHNIAWLSPGNSYYFPEPPAGVGGSFDEAQRDEWAKDYFQDIEQLLSPLAHSGVRIFLFNFEILQERVAADPGLYGFASATNCEAGPGSATTPNTVHVNFPGCFYDNSVHPTSAGMALIANYMANQIDAPSTVAPQGAIVTGLATNFAGSAFARLDADRSFEEFGMGSSTVMSYAAPTKDLGPAAPENRWSVYGDVDTAGGSFDRQFLAPAYDYDAIGGTLGVEYRVDPKLRLGGVFGYSASNVSFDVDNAHDRIISYQLAGYGSFTDAHWFADALVAYGLDDFALDRAGVIDTIHGATSADAFTVAGQAGYLVDIGPIRAGPIAGLDYTHAVIHAYTETGDSLLTMMVGQQAVDALTGDAGLQLRFPFVWRDNLYSPFVNVTAEQDFLGSGRMVTTTQVTTPLLPVLTPVPSDNRVYGKVAAGVAASLGGNVSATLTAATTFARQGGADFTVSCGIKAAF
jgi:uncharacterized protein YhjY with autotransporter beta-barrel domain/phospholipase/lecithinase/hemolysin